MANFFVFIFVYSTLSFLHNFTHKKTFSLHLSRNLSPNPRHVQHRCKIPCKLPFSRARHNWHFLAIEPTKAIYLWFIVFRIYKHGTSESSDLSKAAFSTELGPLVPVSVVCCLQGTWPCITEWFDQTCIFLWIFMTGMRISIYLHRLPLRLFACPSTPAITSTPAVSSSPEIYPQYFWTWSLQHPYLHRRHSRCTLIALTSHPLTKAF